MRTLAIGDDISWWRSRSAPSSIWLTSISFGRGCRKEQGAVGGRSVRKIGELIDLSPMVSSRYNYLKLKAQNLSLYFSKPKLLLITCHLLNTES